MLMETSLKDDYKSLMRKIVCSLDSKDCMLQRCESCPGKEALEKYVCDVFDEFDPADQISFKQHWIHTDRHTLNTCLLITDDFILEIAEKLYLTSHHFISKHHSSYLSSLKKNLLDDNAIILMDLSENYSFIIQDAV